MLNQKNEELRKQTSEIETNKRLLADKDRIISEEIRNK